MSAHTGKPFIWRKGFGYVPGLFFLCFGLYTLVGVVHSTVAYGLPLWSNEFRLLVVPVPVVLVSPLIIAAGAAVILLERRR